MKHIVSWSGGKDSTATIILAHEHGLPIDLIIISLVWFDKKRNIYGEYPEHVKWIFDYAIPLFNSWGYKVEVVTSKHDYLHYFYHIRTRSKTPERNGKRVGFLIGGKCEMNGEKVRPIKKRIKEYAKENEYEEYEGIAVDEPSRLKRLHKKENVVSLLEKYGYTESMAYEKCKEYGLLSPMYQISKRGGCWFCPNQKTAVFAYLKITYPELWAELKELSNVQNTISSRFKYNKSFVDVEAEVDNYILAQEYAAAQLSIFDILE